MPSIVNHVFWRCSCLTSITIPNSVTSIGDGAFYGCSGLTSITIPNSVTSIGESAFYGCSGLTSVTIPNSVTSIGDMAFYGCTGITQTIIVNDMFFFLPKGYEGHYSIPENISTIVGGAFAYCSSLTSVTIPNSVTTIGESAFERCTGLTSVTIPNSVTSIGKSAFQSCNSLTSVTIPNSVTSIGESAFYGCSGLTSVTIPNSVTSIGKNAFLLNNSIEKLYYDCTVDPSIYSSALKELYIGDNISIVYDFFKDNNLSKIVLGKKVTHIRAQAFYNSHIEEFTITGEEPPYLYPNVFGTQDLSKATLYVPESKTGYYQTTEPWSKFGKILRLSGDTPEGPQKCATPSISYSDGKRRSLNFPWQAPEVLTKRWCNMIQDRTNFCTFAPMKKEPTTINKDFIISFFLPDGMTDWFEIVGMREKPNGGTAQADVLYSSVLHIYLDERDNRIGDQLGLKPNGFTEATVIKDYPIRNRKVLLHVRRRRYLDADGRNIILNQYPLTADGTKLSVEFGLFFKDGDGQPSVDGSVIGKILSY